MAVDNDELKEVAQDIVDKAILEAYNVIQNGDDDKLVLKPKNSNIKNGTGVEEDDFAFHKALADSRKNRTDNANIDRGWAWVIVAASFLTNISSGSCYIAFAVFYVEFSDVFEDSGKASIGFVGSLLMAVALISGALHGSLINIWGCRIIGVVGCLIAGFGLILSSFATSLLHLYFTYGIITGFGVGMVFLSSIIIVQQYFVKKRPFAAGFSLIGFSVGSFAMAPLLRMLVNIYAWRGALLLHAAVVLHALPFMLLFRPLPERKVKVTTGRTDSETGEKLQRKIGRELRKEIRKFAIDVCDVSLFKCPKFLLYVIGTYLMSYGMYTFEYHFPSRAVALGVDRNKASLLSLILAGVSSPCRIILSALANAKGVNRTLMYGFGISGAGFVCCATPFCATFVAMAVLAGLYGVAIAAYMSIQTTVLSDLLGVERIAKSQGLTCLFFGLATLKATPFAGWIYDLSGNYNYPFIVTGLIQAVGGLVICLIPIFERKERNKGLPKVRIESPSSFADTNC